MKPILFNTEMVKAIMEGRKTVTRRVIKLPHRGYFEHEPPLGVVPPYREGDILYVRETFTVYQTVNYIRKPDGRSFSEVSDGQYAYKADGFDSIDDLKDHIRLMDDMSFEACEVWDDRWHPSIHMPKKAARLFLRMKSVRVEQLQDIDGHGILKEGVDNGRSNPTMGVRWENMQRMAFHSLWNSTIKPADLPAYGWHANPWVWVIEFERCGKPEATP